MNNVMTLLTMLVGVAHGQSVLSGFQPGNTFWMQPSDASVLELQEPRHEIQCSVTPIKPQLGFDFTFHTGYRVTVPIRELTGARNALTVLLRVTPTKHPEASVYFSQKMLVPKVEEGKRGDAGFDGAFLVGGGKYHVAWLMRDARERYCAAFWDVEAKLSSKEGQLEQSVARDFIQAGAADPFEYEPYLTHKQADRLLSVKVIINFEPQRAGASSLNSTDLDGLLGILRQIGREPRFTRYSIVACSLSSQRIIYQQQGGADVDLAALGRALSVVDFGTVNVKQLTSNPSEFLGQIITQDLDQDHPDIVILVSPDCPLDLKLAPQVTNQLDGIRIFYLNYIVERTASLSGDTISRVVKQLHGIGYTITQPRDLFKAWSEIRTRIDHK